MTDTMDSLRRLFNDPEATPERAELLRRARAKIIDDRFIARLVVEQGEATPASDRGEGSLFPTPAPDPRILDKTKHELRERRSM